MDSRPTTPEDEAALDRAIDAARDGHASQGDGDGLDEFAARLHGFASSGPALDETRIRRTLEARLDSTPQQRGWLRLPSWFAMPAMNRGFAPAAAAVVVALLIGVGALMSTSGSASADFIEDVTELSLFTAEAAEAGGIDGHELAAIQALIDELLITANDPDAFDGIDAEALTGSLETLIAVQAVLDEHEVSADGIDLVSSTALAAYAGGLVAAAGETCTGDDVDEEACKQAFDDAKDGCKELSGHDRGACRGELSVATASLDDDDDDGGVVAAALDMDAAQQALDAFLAVLDEQTDLVEGGLAEDGLVASGLSALTTDLGDWQASIDAALADALALLVDVPVIDSDSLATKENAEALEEQLDALKDDLDEAREALEDAFEPMLDDLDAAIEELDALFAEADDAVEKAAEPFDDSFRIFRDDVKAYIADLHILFEELRDDAHAQRDDVKDAIDAAEAELAEAVEAVKTALDAARDDLKLLKEGLVDDEDEDGEDLKAAGLDEDDEGDESEDDDDSEHEGDEHSDNSGENADRRGRSGEADD